MKKIIVRYAKYFKKHFRWTYLGKPLHKVYPYATEWEVKRYKFDIFVAKVFIGAFILGVGVGGFKLGLIAKDATITYGAVEVIKEVKVPVRVDSGIMKKIAKCESGDKHFTPKGDVVKNVNRDGTNDWGRYQINDVHLPTAKKLGLDIKKEKDNEAFAYYLLDTQGTDPWYSSKSCWKN